MAYVGSGAADLQPKQAATTVDKAARYTIFFTV